MSDNNQYVTQSQLDEMGARINEMEARLMLAISKIQPQADSKSETKAEPKADSKPETKSETKAEPKAEEQGFFGKAWGGFKNHWVKVIGGAVVAGAAYWFFTRSDSDESGGTIDFRKQQMNKMVGVPGGNRSAA